MNLVKEKQGGPVPPDLKRWPFKLIRHFVDTTRVSPSPAVSADINCYVCSTQPGGLFSEDCGDYFRVSPTSAPECAFQGTCFKARGYRSQGGREVVEVSRGCVSHRAEGCEDTTYAGIAVEMCYCNTIFCNLSNNLTGSLQTCLLLSVLGAFLVKTALNA